MGAGGTELTLASFGLQPWRIVIIKSVAILLFLLLGTMLTIWAERRPIGRHFRAVLAAARVMPPSLWRRQITRWTDWTPSAITRYAGDRPGGESEKAGGIS